MLVSRKMLSQVQLYSSLPYATSLRGTTPHPTARKKTVAIKGTGVLYITDTPKCRSDHHIGKGSFFWVGTPETKTNPVCLLITTQGGHVLACPVPQIQG